MTIPLDLLAIGNAIVDVIAPADDALVEAAGLVKGSMRLIGEAEALDLQARMEAATPGEVRKVSGGSAANTAAVVAALGGRAGFIGRLGNDEVGELFDRELREAGVSFVGVSDAHTATARCLILVTGDAQRSMCTFPGAAHKLAVPDLNDGQVAAAHILFLEGYLWDSPSARAAMEHASRVARQAGRKVALTPSDIACVQRCGDHFRAMIDQNLIDMLFLNDAELAAFGVTPSEMARRVELLVVTHGADGATAFQRGEQTFAPAAPVARLVDTTGAGDAFAAGFLSGHLRSAPVRDSLRLGAAAAADVIGRYGARPPPDLRKLI
jgi:sugar/nucleoside kinase (ribokinase family)